MSHNDAVSRAALGIHASLMGAVRGGVLPKDLVATVTPHADGSIDIRVDFSGGWEVAPAEQAVPDWSGFGSHVVQLSSAGRAVMGEVTNIVQQRVHGVPEVTWVGALWVVRALRPTDFPDLDPTEAAVFLGFRAQGHAPGPALEFARLAMAALDKTLTRHRDDHSNRSGASPT